MSVGPLRKKDRGEVVLFLMEYGLSRGDFDAPLADAVRGKVDGRQPNDGWITVTTTPHVIQVRCIERGRARRLEWWWEVRVL